MRDLFPGHFKLDRDELNSLWRSGVFIFDANILLGLYRYSEETRKQFIDVLTSIQERCWLPYQATSEFFERRLDVIGQQQSAHETTLKAIDDFEGKLSSVNQHPFISKPLLSLLSNNLKQVRGELQENVKLYKDRLNDDEILDTIEHIFTTRIGKKFEDQELADIFQEGKERYKNKVPPGYEDNKKDNPDGTRKYGDLVIWKEILRKAESIDVGIIFVTDDKKEDWWREFKGLTIGPRPELVLEFGQVSNHNFHMYKSDQFLKFAGQFLNQRVTEPALNEIRTAQQEGINTTKAKNRYLKWLLETARSDLNNDYAKATKHKKLLNIRVELDDLRRQQTILNSRLTENHCKTASIADEPTPNEEQAAVLRELEDEFDSLMRLQYIVEQRLVEATNQYAALQNEIEDGHSSSDDSPDT